MKNIFKLFAVAILVFSSSCAMLTNDKLDTVSINSSPSGADIYIDGKHMGATPATLNIEPKDYNVQLKKPGYGSTEIKLEYWVAAKTKSCMLDAVSAMFVIPLYSFYWSGYCNEFKEDQYSAVIPRNAVSKRLNSRKRGYDSRNGSRNYYNYRRNY